MSRVVIARVRSKRPSFITLRLDDLTPAVEQSDSGAVLLSVDRTNLFVPVAVAVTGLPANVTAVVETPTLTVTEAGTAIVFSAASNASVGTTRITITATPTGGQAVTIEADLSISAPSIPQGITITPDADVLSKQLGDTFDITYTLVRAGGYAGNVTLTGAAFPAGVTVSYPDGQVFSGGDTTKRIRGVIAGGATPVSNASFTATASGAGVSNYVDSGLLTILTPTQGGSYVPQVFDDFSGYANDAAFQAVLTANSVYAADSIRKDLASIDTSVLYNGRQTLKYSQPIGSATPQLIRALGADLSDVFLRVVMQLPTGFRLDGTPVTSAPSYKLMGFEFASGIGREIFALSYNDLQLEGRLAGTAPIGQPAYPYFGTVLRQWAIWANSAKWFEWVNHYKIMSTHHIIWRGWVYEKGQLPTTGNYCTNSLKDHRNTASPARRVLLNRNFNLTRSYAQQLNIAEYDAVNNATYPDPYQLGNDMAAVPVIELSIDNATISVARGGSVQRTLTIDRKNGFAGIVYCLPESGYYGETRPNPQFPSGVSMTFSATQLASGVNTTVVTIAATAGATPGTTTHRIYLSGQWRNGNNVHASNDYVTINLTVT